MSKQLITASDIRQAQAAGQNRIDVVLPHCIVTPEAKTVASQLGIALIEHLNDVQTATTCSTAGDPLQQIRQQVLDRLPSSSVDPELVEQLVRKVAQEQQMAASKIKQTPAPTAARSIKLVQGRDVIFDCFEGAGIEKQVGIADVIGAADNSSMAAGFMQWSKAFFPWTLTYDEVNVVLEGELHICHQGVTTIARAGDVLFIPNGSAIEFGTPTHVRCLYVAWPANWQ